MYALLLSLWASMVLCFSTFSLYLFFGLCVDLVRRYGFWGCVFAILSPMVFPSCRPVVVATAF